MRIAENVEVLQIPMESHGFKSSIFLSFTWDEDHLVIFDSGYPDMIDVIEKTMNEVDLDLSKVTDILLTHQDIDHIGSCLDILKKAPQAKVYAFTTEAPYIDGRKVPTKLADMEALGDLLPPEKKNFYQMLKSGFAHRQIPIDVEVVDGQILPMCGGIQVVATPGHTPGHCSYFLQESQTMIVGDAANVADGTLIGPNPNMTKDIDLGLKSLERLKEFPMSTAVCYHTGILKFTR